MNASHAAVEGDGNNIPGAPAAIDDYDDNSDGGVHSKSAGEAADGCDEIDGGTAASEVATCSSTRCSRGKDKFGFLASDKMHQQQPAASQQQQQQRDAKEEERLRKWQQMQVRWPEYFKHDAKFCKAKTRARKGVPNSMRRWAWYQFCNAAKAKRLFPDPFNSIDTAKVSAQTIDEVRVNSRHS